MNKEERDLTNMAVANLGLLSEKDATNVANLDFLLEEDMTNISNMLGNFYESYTNSSGSVPEAVNFVILIDRIERRFPAFDGTYKFGTSRELDFWFRNKETNAQLWHKSYGKREIDSLGVSDSAVYKLFSSMLDREYGRIRISGIYNKEDLSVEIKDVTLKKEKLTDQEVCYS